MLNGLDPIILFQIYKKVPPATAAAPTQRSLTSDTANQTKSTFAVIPIYLSRELTGLAIESESKNIDIETNPDSLSTGEAGPVNQKALGSITTINLTGKQSSVGLTILLSLAEKILEKVASQEYEVTYMHGAITVFGGLIHGISIEPGNNDDLYKIKIELARGRPKPKATVSVGEDPNAVRLASRGTLPAAGAPTVTPPPAGSTSVISPRMP